MKVIITSCFKLYPSASGHSTRALAIAEYLAKTGFYVTVLSPETGIDPAEIEDYRQGYDIIFFKNRRRWNPIINFSFMKKLIKEIKKNETCVIVEHPYQGLMVHFLSKILRFPYILDEHNIEYLRLKSIGKNNLSKLFYPIEKFLIKKCDAVLAASPNEASLIKAKSARDPLFIPNGVNMDRFYPTEKDSKLVENLGLSGFKLIVFFANYDYKLNVEAVEAINSYIAPKVYEQREDVRFIIIGKNPPAISYHPAIITTGYVKEIEKYINIADVIIAPLSAGTGTRLKILEAMACAKTVIASYLGAKGIILENNKDIILCAVNDFPEKILSCLNNETNQEIPVNARKKALDYDWELILNPLKKLIYNER